MHFISQFSEVINAALDEFFPPGGGVKIIAEPGRYFVESVFTLAAAVVAKKVIDYVDEDCGNATAIFKGYYLKLLYNFIALYFCLFVFFFLFQQENMEIIFFFLRCASTL